MNRHLRLSVLICLALVGCDDKSAPLAPGYEVPDVQRRDANPTGDMGLTPDSTLTTDVSIPIDAMQRTDAAPLPVDSEVTDLTDAGETFDASEGDASVVDLDAGADADGETIETDSMTPNPGELPCSSLYECQANCGLDDDCNRACRENAQEDTIALLLTLEACLTDNGCLVDNQIGEVCANENCREDYLSCFGEESLPPLEEPLSDCRELADCDTACGDDGACRIACAEDASPDARLAFANYMRCVMENGESNCASEYESCFGELPPLTCEQLFECINECPVGDPECAPTCIETASETAVDQLNERTNCLSQSACAGDDYACRLTDCEPELTACFGPPVIPTGTTTCTTLSDCIDLCDSGDTDCGDACLAAASPEGYNQFFDVFYCAQDNGCDTLMDADAYAECMRTNCDAELTVCTESGLGQGTLNCEEIYDCASLCPAGDADCTRQCLGSASQEGLTQARDYESCLQSNGCADADYACDLITCSTEIRNCFGSVGVPGGTESCSELNDCLGLCADGDTVCTDLCIQRSAPEEYNDFMDVVMCDENSGCNGNVDCFNNVCAEEISTCLDDEQPNALLDCTEYNDCLADCAGDLLCQQTCQTNASGIALAQHRAIFECAELNFCTTLTGELDTDCLTLNCTDELNACFGPPVTPSGTGTCPELFGCLEACPPDNDACDDACVTATSQVGFDAAVAYSECAVENCDGLADDAFQACISANCQTELLECLAN
ncbi:MAG: hypothetical protein ACPGQS_05980 [Bradymonadia bacterium]